MMQLGMLGADIIKWGAVDEEGNRVDDVRDAKYFLVPGTKSESSSGVKLPLTSLATLTVNYPSFGIGILMAASIAQRVEVKTAESLKAAMGETLYGEMFPYGISNNPLSNIAGAYQKDIWRAAWGTADTDFNRSVMSLYGYQMYEWEKNGEQGEQPTLDDAIDDIAAYYSSNAAKKFVSPFSIQTPIEGDLMAEAWSEFEQKYEGDTQAAREAFTAKYGDAARWLTMPTSMRTAYVPPTMAAQERVWEQFPDVAKRLVAIDPANPEYVSLLAYGTGGTYSSEVSKFMQTNPLPGDDTTLVENMDPTEFDSRAQQSLGWDAYSAGKTKYDAEHLRLVTLRDEATSEFEKQHYRDKINGLDQEWSGWVTSLEESNKPWAKQKGGSGEETADIATLYLNEILAEPDLAKLEEFQKVAAFLKQREIAKTAYAAAGDDEKKALKSQFTDYVRVNFAENDPDFTSLWDRYYASEWDIANGG
jgi:hypothetical protein